MRDNSRAPEPDLPPSTGETVGEVLGEAAATSPIVLPPPDVWAIVPFAPAPEQPPEDLRAFAIRRGDNWVLTDDALAFGQIETIERFHAWRATWEQVWTLDPLTNLLRLIELAREIAPSADGTGGLLDKALTEFLTDDDIVEIPVDRQVRAAAAVDQLAELVRERGAKGYGIVDRSPNIERVGLARAWPACGEAETMAASAELGVVFDPEAGLFCELPSADDRFGPVDRAESSAAIWTVWSGDRELQLTGEQSLPLHWLLPGATAWVVRRVPEVLAWARTFSGLAEAFEFGQRIGAPVRLTARRPIADYGSSSG